jgi:hypothetical protein
MSNPHLLKLSPLLDELRQLVQATDQPLLTETVRPLLAGFPQSRINSDNFSVWVWVYGNANEQERDQVEACINNDDHHLWQYSNTVWKTPPPYEVNLYWHQDWEAANFDDLQRHPAIYGIFFICEDALPRMELVLNHIALVSEQLPALVIVSGLDWQAQTEALRSMKSACQRTENWQQAAQATIKNDLSILFTPAVFDVLEAVHAGAELERVKSIFEQILQQCESDLKVRRQQVQQEIALAQRAASPSGVGSSSFMEFKSRFQQRVEQFEKRQTEQLEEKLAGGRGSLALSMENMIEQLTGMEERKTAKNIVFSIPDEFKKNLTDNFITEARRYCNEAIAGSTLFYRSMEETVHGFLEVRNLHLSMPGAALPDGERIEQLLLQTARFERNFEGTAMKKKPMEIIMGARIYIMMLMMGASMLGIAGLMRKNMDYYLPVVIILLGLGIWQFLVLKQKEDQENKEKQMSNAKEYLKTEIKRILQEFSRLWEKAHGGAIKEWSAAVLREVDSILQSAEQGSKGQREAAGNRLKNILATLQNQERAIEGVQRSKLTLDRNFSKTKGELAAQLKIQLVKFRQPLAATDTRVMPADDQPNITRT